MDKVESGDKLSRYSFNPKGCKAGINRFLTGKSNSESIFTTGGEFWSDPEFGADDSSLSWGKFGYERETGSPPNGLKWKRPKDIFSESPSLWGSSGKA